MKRILIIGNGGREHAVAEAFRRSRHRVEIYVLGGAVNPALKEIAAGYEVGDVCDCSAVTDFAQRCEIDFAFPGPEAPIAAGVVDALAELGIPSVAPLKELAQLESSKGFCRDLVEKYGIGANPEYKRFSVGDGESDMDGIVGEMKKFAEKLNGEFVVKADGLRSGKGVSVAGDHFASIDEGLAIAKECLAADGTVVVEEKFVGPEFSLMSFSDGEKCVDMPCVRDHKRAFVGDKGPNTGGMGSISEANHRLSYLSEEDVDRASEITCKVVAALKEETGKRFHGIMFGGFIKTANGVKLIEYNARFGDPESVNVLLLLKTDFVDICEALIQDRLHEVKVEFEEKATVCKYIVPEGYPNEPLKGEPIVVGEMPEGVKAFYAAVDQKEDGQLVMTGSRAVAVIGKGDSIGEAEKLAEAGARAVQGKVFYREDIGRI